MKIFRNWDGNPQPSYVTVGNYDGVHRGHQSLLTTLNEIANPDAAKIVMTFDPHPLAVLHPQRTPARIIDLHTKIARLADCGIDQINVVHFTRKFAAMPAELFIQRLCQKLNMRCLVVGSDFSFGHQRRGDTKLLKKLAAQMNFELKIISNYYDNNLRVSSKLVREVLASGNLKQACQLLGSPYRFYGRIVYGDQLGRSLGFPTANLRFSGNIALKGIFAAKAYLAGQLWPAALSIGYRPVVNGKHLCIEAHLINFTGDIYGKEIIIEPVQKIRDEQNYSDLAKLKAAIAEDVKKCMDILDNPTTSSQRSS